MGGASPVVAHASHEPSVDLIRACAMFGVLVRRRDGGAPTEDPEAVARADAWLGPGAVALVSGPSGSGKSTFLRAWSRLRTLSGGKGAPIVRADRLRRERSVLDAVVRHGSPGVDEALRTLARAGLADATLLSRTPGELSEGQRVRLELACAMARVPEGERRATTVVVDEFASVLDRTAAMGVSMAAARWARRLGVRLLVATAHDDVRAWLDPDVLVECGLDGTARVTGRGPRRGTERGGS